MTEMERNNPVLNSIRARLHRRNQNWLAVFLGETGSGKSYGAMHVANYIDKNFTIKNVVFTPRQFLERLNSGELKKGACIVFDEAGVGLPSREWYSVQNRLLSYVLQTFRHKNIACIFTVPNISFIDVAMRRLFHAFIETISIDYENKICITKYFLSGHKPSDKSGDFIRRYPRIRLENGELVKVTRFNCKYPELKLVRAYEKKKKEYTNQLNLDAQAGIEKMEEKLRPKETKKDEIVKLHKKGMKPLDIAKTTKSSITHVRQTLRLHS